MRRSTVSLIMVFIMIAIVVVGTGMLNSEDPVLLPTATPSVEQLLEVAIEEDETTYTHPLYSVVFDGNGDVLSCTASASVGEIPPADLIGMDLIYWYLYGQCGCPPLNVQAGFASFNHPITDEPCPTQ